MIDRERGRGEFSVSRKYISSCIWPLLLPDRNTALQVLPNGIDHYKNTCFRLGKQRSRRKVPWLSCGSKYCLRGANNNHSQWRFQITRHFHSIFFHTKMSLNNRDMSVVINHTNMCVCFTVKTEGTALTRVTDRVGGITQLILNIESSWEIYEAMKPLLSPSFPSSPPIHLVYFFSQSLDLCAYV